MIFLFKSRFKFTITVPVRIGLNRWDPIRPPKAQTGALLTELSGTPIRECNEG